MAAKQLSEKTQTSFRQHLLDYFEVDMKDERLFYEEKLLSLMNENENLKFENANLNERLNDSKKDAEKLAMAVDVEREENIDMVQKLKGINKAHEKDKRELHEKLNMLTARKLKLTIDMKRSQHKSNTTLAKLKQEYEVTVSSLQSEVSGGKKRYLKAEEALKTSISSQKEQTQRLVEEIKDKHMKEVHRLKTDLSEAAARVQDLEKRVNELEKQLKTERRAFGTCRGEYDQKNSKLQEQLDHLQRENKSMMTREDLTPTVTLLRKQNTDLVSLIKEKNREISSQEEGIKKLHEHINRLKSQNGFMKATLELKDEELEDKEKEMIKLQKEIKSEISKSNDLVSENSKMIHETQSLTASRALLVTENKDLDDMVERMCQRHLVLQRDLQDCHDTYGKRTFPRVFTHFVEKYKNTDLLPVYKGISEYFREREQKIRDRFARVEKAHRSEMELAMQTIHHVHCTYYTERQLKAMNDTHLECFELVKINQQLRRELAGRDVQIRKLTKPIGPKIQSWWHKKVLKRTSSHCPEGSSGQDPSDGIGCSSDADKNMMDAGKHEDAQLSEDDSRRLCVTSPERDVQSISQFISDLKPVPNDGLPIVDI